MKSQWKFAALVVFGLAGCGGGVPLVKGDASPSTAYAQAVVSDGVIGHWSLNAERGGTEWSFEQSMALEAEAFGGPELAVELWTRRPKGTFVSYFADAMSMFVLGALDGNLVVTFNSLPTDTRVHLPDDDGWHHVALSWRSVDGAVELSVDGLVEWTGLMRPGKPVPLGGTLVVGQVQSCPGGCFVAPLYGGIADLSLRNRWLDASKVAAHYALGGPAAAPGGAVAVNPTVTDPTTVVVADGPKDPATPPGGGRTEQVVRAAGGADTRDVEPREFGMRKEEVERVAPPVCADVPLSRDAQRLQSLLDKGNVLWPGKKTVRALADKRFEDAYTVWQKLPPDQQCLTRALGAEALYRRAEIKTFELFDLVGTFNVKQHKELKGWLAQTIALTREYQEAAAIPDLEWSPRSLLGASRTLLDMADRLVRMDSTGLSDDARDQMLAMLEEITDPIRDQGDAMLKLAWTRAVSLGNDALADQIASGVLSSGGADARSSIAFTFDGPEGRETLSPWFRSHRTAMESCVLTEARHGRATPGRMALRFQVDASGKARQVEVAANKIGAEAATCLKNLLMGGQFATREAPGAFTLDVGFTLLGQEPADDPEPARPPRKGPAKRDPAKGKGKDKSGVPKAM